MTERASSTEPTDTERYIDGHEKTFYLIPSMYKMTSMATFWPLFVAVIAPGLRAAREHPLVAVIAGPDRQSFFTMVILPYAAEYCAFAACEGVGEGRMGGGGRENEPK